MSNCVGLTGCQKRLCEAQNGYHLLMTTGKPVRILHADGEVEYQKIKAGDLLDYINLLKSECGGPGGTPLVSRRPIRFGGGGGGCC